MREFIVRTDKQNTCDGILTNALQVAVRNFHDFIQAGNYTEWLSAWLHDYFSIRGYKTNRGVYSFLTVSSPLSLFQNEKRGGNNKEAV